MKKLEALDVLDIQKAEVPTQFINDESMASLEPSLAEEIKELQIPHLVKLEDLFDQELLNKIDYSSLEISIIQEQKVRILIQMKKEIDQKKVDLESNMKQDCDYQIEFLELNYKYLETLSNNVMKKARRKTIKQYSKNGNNEKAGL